MAHTHRSLSRAMMDVLADDEAEEAPAAPGAPAEEKPSPEDDARPSEAERSAADVQTAETSKLDSDDMK